MGLLDMNSTTQKNKINYKNRAGRTKKYIFGKISKSNVPIKEDETKSLTTYQMASK